MKYIKQAEAARVIGISKQALSKRIKQGKFIRGYLIYNPITKREEIRYSVIEVVVFAKSRLESLT